MTQPSDGLLLKYVSGVLDPALRMVVEKHLQMRRDARKRLAAFEQLGGLLLAAEPGENLTAGMLDRVLGRLAGMPDKSVSALMGAPQLDAVNWRWAGRGRRIAKIEISGSNMQAYALKIAPGKAMLQHCHTAGEWTLVIQGSYRDEGGEYFAGALIEEDGNTSHRPVATGDIACVCLVVMAGPLVAPGVMGRIAQWLMR